ncbi:MAG: ABC transporter substrate-binding protein, partial [Micromonosporaceae bacterium]|nr:ABC transporter substrate-binding protein [Micromonosporaceae bacterium]
GEVDVMTTIPAANVGEARTSYGDRLIEEPNSTFTYLGFPTYDKKFENVKLRQAISMAIDRKAIIKTVYDDRFVPAKSLVSPVVPGHRDDACQTCDYDPEQAKKLLEEAGGWPKGEKLTLWFNAGSGHEDWVKPVGDQLKKNLGIDYQLEGELDFPQYLEKADGKKFTGAFRLGWVMDYPSPENYLKPLHGTQGSSNNTGYSNPAADKLIAEGDNSATLDEAIAKYQEAEDLMLADMPVAPMWFGRTAIAYNDNVENMKFSIVDSDPFWSELTVK